MRKALCLTLLCLCWNVWSQGVQLQPMEAEVYTVHSSLGGASYTSAILPQWTKSAPPSKGGYAGYHYVDVVACQVENLTADNNWVGIDRPTSMMWESRVSKDDQGNVWLAFVNPLTDEVEPFCLVKGKQVQGTVDLLGIWWVSWYLVPGTRDVYPQFNFISDGERYFRWHGIFD